MKKIKQILSIVLCLAMLASLTACSSGDGKKDAQDSGDAAGSDIVYVPEYQTIGADVGDLEIFGGKLYGTNWSYNEETGESKYNLVRWDLGTMEKEELPFDLANGYIRQMVMAGDGTLLLLVGYYGEEKTDYHLIWLDEAGAVKTDKQITELIEGYNTDMEFGVSPQNMAVDQDGNIYLMISSMEETLVVLDGEGNKLFDLSMDSWSEDMVTGRDGRVYLLSYDRSGSSGGYVLKTVDPEKKAWGDTYTGIPDGSGSVNVAAEDETHFLISGGDVLYRYDITTQSMEKVLNWLDCDINADDMQSFDVLEDGRIVAGCYHWGEGESSFELALLTAKKASEVKQKTVITYGTLYLDYRLREQIIAFNKENQEYRIEVKDYSNMGSSATEDGSVMDAGLSAFNADLAAGNVPDLIELSVLNFTNYAGKGIFADLNTLMEGDSELSRDDLVANPLKIYEMDGKQYGIPLFFSINTLMGRTSVLHGKTGWTIQDIQQILAEQPEGTEFMSYSSQENLMYALVAYQLDQYIDWGTGTCSFDGQEFIDTLNFVSSFPPAESINYDDSEGIYSRIHNGKVLVLDNDISSIGWYLAMLAMFDNDDVTFIGYPTSDGSNGSMLISSEAMAISASSKNQEGAWTFLKYLLTEHAQSATDSFRGFPVLQSALDSYLATAMTDEFTGSGFGWDDFSYEQAPATQEQIDMLKNLIDTAKPMNMSTDESITEIIMEEVAPLFSGQKTAEDVAKIIQSRVSIYVSENY